ncbi:MAG: hypothetical protein K6F69_07780, partial [Treponema sp.]|nr:hypothetical protein [Treponema sp.]
LRLRLKALRLLLNNLVTFKEKHKNEKTGIQAGLNFRFFLFLYLARSAKRGIAVKFRVCFSLKKKESIFGAKRQTRNRGAIPSLLFFEKRKKAYLARSAKRGIAELFRVCFSLKKLEFSSL